MATGTKASLLEGMTLACELEAFLSGTLDPSADARSLLELDLLSAWADSQSLLEALRQRPLAEPPAESKAAAGLSLSPVPCEESAALRMAALAASGQLPRTLPELVRETRQALTGLRVRAMSLSAHDLAEAWAVWSARRQMAGLAAASMPEDAPSRLLQAALFMRGELPLGQDPKLLAKLPLWHQGTNEELLNPGPLTAGPGAESRDTAATWRALAAWTPAEWAGALERHRQRQQAHTLETARWLGGELLAWAQQRLERTRSWLEQLHAAAAQPTEVSGAAKPKPEETAEAPVPVPEAAPIPQGEAVQAEQQAEAAEKTAAQARQRQAAALKAAAQTQDQERRTVEAERARLLGLLAEAALFEGEIQRTRQHLLAELEEKEQWGQRVAALGEGVVKGSVARSEADAAWDELMADLDALRTRFSEAVSSEVVGQSRVPDLRSGLDLSGLPPAQRQELQTLREEVIEAYSPLLELESNAMEERSDRLYQTTTVLAAARIQLIDLLSEEKHAQVTGMGSKGWEQVTRAMAHLATVLEYRLVSAPRRLNELWAKAAEDVPKALLSLLIAVTLLVGGFWWYRKGQALLMHWERTLREGPAWRSRTLWLAARVHKPVVALVGLYALVALLGGPNVPELGVIWEIGLWITVGILVVNLVDALVTSYERLLRTPGTTQVLRRRTLKFLCTFVVVGGILLGGTESLLGKGVLYRWLGTLWGLSLLPAGLWALHWWKPTIWTRLEELPRQTGFSRWLVQNNKGAIGWLNALMGAGLLFVIAVARWALFAASRLYIARRLHTWLFRREVSRYAKLQPTVELVPIPDSVRCRLASESSKQVVEPVRNSALEDAVAQGGGLIFLVGDKGIGKSTLMRHMEARSDQKSLWLECGAGGTEALLAQMAEKLGVASLAEQEIARCLASSGIRRVFIDEGQMLVRPVVNGLADLERLRTWVRLAEDGDICWIVALGLHSWRYVQRAAGSRLLADQVVELPMWDEESIAALLTSRTAGSALHPSFDGLMASNAPVDADVPAEAQLSETWYYRLLWDYSGGNPAIALHFWARSLFQDPSGQLFVRLFAIPDESQVEALPLDLLFLLRVMVQMGKATPILLADATRLPLPDVTDALRLFRSKGFTIAEGPLHSVSWEWRRAIVKTLVRQHLLVV